MKSKERWTTIIIDPRGESLADGHNVRELKYFKIGGGVIIIGQSIFNLPLPAARIGAFRLREELEEKGRDVEIFEGSLEEGIKVIEERILPF